MLILESAISSRQYRNPDMQRPGAASLSPSMSLVSKSRESKMPGFWVFVPPLLLGTSVAASAALGVGVQLPSGYHFIFHTAPLVGGAAAFVGLLARLFKSRISVLMAVLGIATCWVPLLFLIVLAAAMSLRSMATLGAYLLLPTLLLLLVFFLPPTISLFSVDSRMMTAGIILAVVCVAVGFRVFPPQTGAGNQRFVTYADSDAENSAIGLVRNLNVALYAYNKKFRPGYVGDLEQLRKAPSGDADAQHANLFAPEIYHFEVGSTPNTFLSRGYSFAYQPEADPSGTITGYSIVARPTGHGGVRSFYSDSTYVIRATSENRAADSSDPPI